MQLMFLLVHLNTPITDLIIYCYKEQNQYNILSAWKIIRLSIMATKYKCWKSWWHQLRNNWENYSVIQGKKYEKKSLGSLKKLLY